MKKLSKLLMMVMALFLAMGTSVSAANYTAIPGTTTKLDKYLVVEADAEIPEAEFTFTMGAGNAVEATATTVKTWAGLNPELVKVNGTAGSGKVNFVAGEAATAGPKDGVATAEQKYAVKDINLDFSAVSFAEPGVYRYTITEAAPLNGSPIKHDEEPVRTIDVYVEDVNGALQVKGYVVYEGTITDAAKTLPSPIAAVDMAEWDAQNEAPAVVAQPAAPADPENLTPEEEAAQAAYEAYLAEKAAYDEARAAEIARQEAANLAAATAEVPNGAEAGTPKSDKYVNTMDSADLKVKKTVTGNQGSHDEYFEFTITVNNAGNGTVMTLDMTGAETSTHENTATSFAKADMDEANARDDVSAGLTKYYYPVSDTKFAELVVKYGDEELRAIAAGGLGEHAIVIETDPEEVTRKLYVFYFGEGDEAKAARDAFAAENPREDMSSYPQVYLDEFIDDVPSGTADKAGQQIVADENGFATFKVYLHHGQEAVLKGLPVGATYTVVETPAAGYETKYNVKLGNAEAVEKQAVANERIGADDVEVDTINHRNGVIPTGILVSAGAGIGLVGLAAAGIVLSRRRKDEE